MEFFGLNDQRMDLNEDLTNLNPYLAAFSQHLQGDELETFINFKQTTCLFAHLWGILSTLYL